jgi:hypothetical protein
MRSKHKHWCRRPHTTAEMRANQDREYVRGKRLPSQLPSWYDDITTTQTRNWKDHRKTQYRTGKRGQKHELIFDNLSRRQQWVLEEYFKAHDIPHNVEDIKRKERRKYVIHTESVKDYQIPVFTFAWLSKGHQIGYRWIYKDVPLDKPIIRWYNYSVTIGTRVVWWSDKDIGIDFILRRIQE